MSLYWQDESDNPAAYTVPDTIVDIYYKLKCRSLPVDHIQSLSDAIHKSLPWVKDEDKVSIPAIHVAESANGWVRPENANALLYLSRRTRMSLRVPQHRVEDAQKLSGQILDIDGCELEVGEPQIRKLSKLTTIFSRYVTADEVEDEKKFMQSCHDQLITKGIRPKKMLTGLLHKTKTHQGTVLSRSLLLAELEIEQSIMLQQQGLGDNRKLGFGIFLPHKGIEAVRKVQDAKKA